jgi:hypothetical protein
MADIDDKDTTGKRDREEEANDDLSTGKPYFNSPCPLDW